MPNKKVTELPVATSVDPTDVLLVVQGGVTKQVSQDTVAASLSTTYAALLTPSGTFTWNSDGTIATQTIGGVTTTFAWNSDGTLNTETRAGVTRTYSYNGDGTLAGVA